MRGGSQIDGDRPSAVVAAMSWLRRRRTLCLTLALLGLVGILLVDLLVPDYAVAAAYLVLVVFAAIALPQRTAIVIGSAGLALTLVVMAVQGRMDGENLLLVGFGALAGAGMLAFVSLSNSVEKVFTGNSGRVWREDPSSCVWWMRYCRWTTPSRSRRPPSGSSWSSSRPRGSPSSKSTRPAAWSSDAAARERTRRPRRTSARSPRISPRRPTAGRSCCRQRPPKAARRRGSEPRRSRPTRAPGSPPPSPKTAGWSPQSAPSARSRATGLRPRPGCSTRASSGPGRRSGARARTQPCARPRAASATRWTAPWTASTG